MNHLFRELAPISEIGWQEIEKEATAHAEDDAGGTQAG